MKLVIAVVQDKDAHGVLTELARRGYGATKLASTGGFLREGNTTIMVGVKAGDIPMLMAIFKKQCSTRQESLPPRLLAHASEPTVPFPIEVTVGGATIFVMDVERYEKI